MKVHLKDDEILVYRICNALDLAACTADGWDLVESFDMSTALTWIETVPDISNGSYHSTYNLTKGGVGTERKFLLQRAADSPIPQLQNRVQILEQRLKETETVHSQALKDKHRELDVHYTERLHKAAAEHQKELSDSRTTNRKLEGDIAKIRQEVGEARMREILSPQS